MVMSLLALFLAGQAPTGEPQRAPVTPVTPQQQFDAASDAAGARDCATAIRLFEAIERAGPTRRNPMLSAAIDLRKGGCLIRQNRVAEGVAAVRRGLPLLTSKGEAFVGDVREAHLMLAYAALTDFDYDDAARHARAAVDLSQGTARIVPLLDLSQILMFDHDGRALAAAEEARTLALASPTYGKKGVATVQTHYARVLLNEGRAAEAYKELRTSLAKQGGLTTRVGAADIATRSDLAIAALQTRDMAGAQQYLAYTGAGRMRDTPFAKAAVMDPPTCAGEGGLTPQDHAIVQFTLEDDGRVSGVQPIYTTGGRAAAVAFSRAVSDWSWRAEDAKKIPLLFRYTTRVELRCIKAPERPAVTRPLEDAVEAWVAGRGTGRGAPAWIDRPAAAALPLQIDTLSRAQATKDQAAILQAALALSGNPVVSAAERPAYLQLASAAATALAAPVATHVLLAIRNEGDAKDAGAYREMLQATLARSDVAADPLSRATLRLLLARPAYRGSMPADAGALFDAVVADAGLAAQHPLKTAGKLGKANVLAARGDLPGARAAFNDTGLSTEQCALVGLQPAMKRSGASSSDYPMAALRLGFEGWVRAEYDIAPDGRTITPRVVAAYPPFVFNDAATGIIRDTRYTSSFRPEGALACSGQQQAIIFAMP